MGGCARRFGLVAEDHLQCKIGRGLNVYTGLSKILVGQVLILKIVLCEETETFATNSVHHEPRYNPGHHANTWSLKVQNILL